VIAVRIILTVFCYYKHMKPVIIYVSGAPGSGKTTLAKRLSRQLNIHHISSDLVHGSIAFLNPSHDRAETIQDVFIPYLIDSAKLGMSFVVDHVLQKDIAKETIIDKLLPYANVLYIHTQAADPISRYKKNIEDHDSNEVQTRHDFLISRAEFHAHNLENTINPIDLDIPRLVVDTNNGYDPSLEEIINFIKDNAHQD